MGKADRIIRTCIALVLGILIVTGVISGTLGIILSILAIIFLITGAAGYCPGYAPFRISTCGKKKEASGEAESVSSEQ